MKKKMAVLLILTMSLVCIGCSKTITQRISYLEIIASGGVEPMSIDGIEIVNNQFVIASGDMVSLEVIARDEQGIRMRVDAEWASNTQYPDGYLDNVFGSTTKFRPLKKGEYVVTATVGTYTAKADIYVYGQQLIMSGNGEIAQSKHAMNFSTGPTENPDEADMILLNKYHPGTPYYAEQNTILFPTGFYPMEFTSLQEIIEVPTIGDDEWIYEITFDWGNFVKGIVLCADGSYAKIIGAVNIQYSNNEPFYLGIPLIYKTTDSTTFAY